MSNLWLHMKKKKVSIQNHMCENAARTQSVLLKVAILDLAEQDKN